MKEDMLLEEIKRVMEHVEDITEKLGDKLDKSDYFIEDMGCPHLQPKSMPKGYAAIYIFLYEKDDEYEFYKIGKANQKTNARFVSQHYGFKAPSTLAKSICKDAKYIEMGINETNIKAWMLENLHRVNIYIKINSDNAITELVEAIFHYRFRPRYEGNI